MSKALKIYIVDDNPGVSHSLQFLLHTLFNVDIQVYQSPLLFLEEYTPEWNGCLIIDFFMPGLNGDELLKEIHQRGCHLKIIMMSGNASMSTPCLKAKGIAFISKPFEIEQLLEQVGLALQIHTGQQMPSRPPQRHNRLQA